MHYKHSMGTRQLKCRFVHVCLNFYLMYFPHLSSVAECRSLAGKLPLSCTQPVADGWLLNHPLQASPRPACWPAKLRPSSIANKHGRRWRIINRKYYMALIDINNRRTTHYTYSYIHMRTFIKTEPVSLSNPTMQPCLLAKPVAQSTASKSFAVLIGHIDSR